MKSQKLQRFEQSYSEGRFATPETTMTSPNYRVANFNFSETLKIKF